MKQVALILVLIGSPLVAAADAPQHVVNDGGATLTLDCGDGGRVVVNGADNKIAVTGGCEKVTVNGSGNTVTLDGVDKLVLTGGNNKVTYAKSWHKKSTTIAKVGSNNVVAKR